MKNRIISGLIMAILFIIFYLLGGNYFIVFISLISILAYKEIIFLKKYPNIVIVLGLISMLGIILSNSLLYGYYGGIKYISILIPIVLLTLPSLIPKYQNKYPLEMAFNLIGLIIFISLSFTALNIFMLTNKLNILYLISIVCLNDIFAFLIGRKIGKHKFSKISPKKSLEGLIAGNIVGLIGGTIFYLVFINKGLNILLIIGVTLILNIAGQLGDLIFSKIKREHDIKDFSNLIPGHGGILDRLDSLLFTSLVYLIIISLI